jgi:hemerythrin-like metal-binding protein
MPNRVEWEPRYSVGNETLDHQHRELLARCNTLADCLADDSEASQQRFLDTFDELMVFAREHFAAEAALLASSGYPELEDHQEEREEFDYLAAEIVTTANFDRIELHRFLALWWVGHIVESSEKYQNFLKPV